MVKGRAKRETSFEENRFVTAYQESFGAVKTRPQTSVPANRPQSLVLHSSKKPDTPTQ